MKRCERCGEDFARKDSLTQHKNRKYHCDVDRKYHYDVNARTDGNEVCKRKRLNSQKTDDFHEDVDDDDDDDDIPTFDSTEFCSDKPLSRQTLERMMKMLKIPEHRWNRIAADILKEKRATKTHLFKYDLAGI